MDYNGKKAAVIGLGKSGRAVAKKLAHLGAQVTLSDQRARHECDPGLIAELESLGIKLELGQHSPSAIKQAELVVVSPGVPTDIPLLKYAEASRIPVISEIEFAWRFLTKPIIAVTGTNGKTTTATLIGEFLKAAGRKAVVAGNIGYPLILVDDACLDFVVVEVSSYQLETIKTFRPWISILLNLTEDHLARHKDMEGYSWPKARIFLNQERTDYLIYNGEDPWVSKMAKLARARLVPFSRSHTGRIKPGEIRIKGLHNLENALAASTAAALAGVSHEVIDRVLKEFPGVEHRIEFVETHGGVSFYNDSKATNPDSTMVALKALQGEGDLYLILGGQDKGTDLAPMCQLIRSAARHVVLIGVSTDRFKAALLSAGYQDFSLAGSLEEAVVASYEKAKENGGIVLLSPACASFDMFRDFEQRGRIFKEKVRSLVPVRA